jgi:hypothetical protein
MRVSGTRLSARSAQPLCLPVNKVPKNLLRCFVDEVLVQAKEGLANDE